MHTVTEAIDASVRALREGINLKMLKSALVADGFQPERAATIIRWSQQFLKKRKENGNKPLTSMGVIGTSRVG